MAGHKPGPAPTRHLTAVKDGNPSKRPIKESPRLPAKMPVEPDWVDIFPTAPTRVTGLKGEARQLALSEGARIRAAATRCRKVARTSWRRWARVLHSQGLLSEVDPEQLQEAAVTFAQLDMANRDIARRGIYIPSERGASKNPSVTAAAQFRTAFKNYAAALGLAPAYRVGLVASWDPGGGGGGADEDDPFD